MRIGLLDKACAIKVHIWGGLGSQLYGAVAAWRIIERFPKRHVILTFHTSGLTRRTLEVEIAHHANISIKCVDDWKPNGIVNEIQPTDIMKQVKRIFLFSLKSVGRQIGFLATPNQDRDFQKIRPWVISLRGDYSRIRLKREELEKISVILGISTADAIQESETNSIALHFRSGDLLTHKTSSYINPRRISKIPNFGTEKLVSIYTDGDGNQVRSEFSTHLPNLKVVINTPKEVIIECFKAKQFVGTSSKLSLWISILRLSHGKSDTFLPHDLLPALKFNLDAEQSGNVKCY